MHRFQNFLHQNKLCLYFHFPQMFLKYSLSSKCSCGKPGLWGLRAAPWARLEVPCCFWQEPGSSCLLGNLRGCMRHAQQTPARPGWREISLLSFSKVDPWGTSLYHTAHYGPLKWTLLSIKWKQAHRESKYSPFVLQASQLSLEPGLLLKLQSGMG